MADVVHLSLCRKYGLQCATGWYKQYGSERPVMENHEVKILSDFHIESDHVVVHWWPHIVVLEKKDKNALLFDIAVPIDVRVEEKEEEKVMKYQCLSR